MSAIPTRRARYRFPPTPKAKVSPLSIVAYHEAGHAVVAWLAFRDMAKTPAPLPVISVAVNEEEPDPDWPPGIPKFTGFCRTPLSDMTWGPLEWDIVCCLAGGLAEAIHWGYRDQRHALPFTLECGGMSGDIEAIKRTFAALRILTEDKDHDDDAEAHRHFAGRAWDLLQANWSAVEAIATALIERRKLDGAEVEALMNADPSATGRTPAI